MTRLLKEDVTQQIQEAFQELQAPVNILFFGTQEDCAYCEDTRQLMQELVALSDLLELHVFDLQEDAATARNYNVERAPSLVITGEDDDGPVDYGIRFAGIPSGYEFGALIQALLMVSGGDSGLQEQTRQFLSELTEPLHLQVFNTPT